MKNMSLLLRLLVPAMFIVGNFAFSSNNGTKESYSVLSGPIEIRVVKTVQASETKNNGFIKIRVTGGTGVYTIKKFGPGGKQIEKGDQFELSNLAPGTYLFVVTDSDGSVASKEIKLE